LKKSTKKLLLWAARAPSQSEKSFLFLFFKKENLPVFPFSPPDRPLLDAAAPVRKNGA
jgi:hypothetical protein